MSENKSRYHILFVNSQKAETYGGGERWYVLMAEWFNQKGYKISLLCRPNSKMIAEFQKFESEIIPFNFSFDFNIYSAFKIYKLIKAKNIDFIFCNFNKDVSIAGMAGRWAKIKKIIFINGYELISKKWKHHWLLPFFDVIISNTEYLKIKYSEYNWGLESRIKVIYNGIRSSDVKMDTFIKSRLLIFGAGRLSHIKNYSLFIKLIKRLLEDNIEVEAAIAGEGEEKEKLKKMIIDYNLPIQLLGHIDNIHPYLIKSDIFLHPSSNEGMPTVIIEAMSRACPSVCFAVGGTAEIVKHNENGLIYTCNDVEGMYKGLKELIQNEVLRKKISEAALQTFKDNFDFDKSLLAIEMLLLQTAHE